MDAPHPLIPVENRAVALADLLRLQIADPSDPSGGLDNAFSHSTRRTLEAASVFPATATHDGRPVIDPGSYLRAELAIAYRDKNAQSAKPNRRVGDAIVQGDLDPIGRLLEKSLGGSANAPNSVVAAPSLTAMLTEAARIADAVTNGAQRRVDARHALVACLRTREAQEAIWAEGLTRDPPTSVMERVRIALETELAQQAASEAQADVSTIWQSELGLLEARSDLRLPEPERRSETHYVRDAPAESLADDRLGLATEIRALAEIMCLKQPGPPLAVGLFGDWGSGKSTYMNMIEAAIGEIGERVKAETAARDLFVDGVVHIKFNAWHYNDADLWTSLTSEFFRQLRSGGHGAAQGADYRDLVREVAEHVAAVDREADNAVDDLANERRAAADARRDLEAAQASGRDARANALQAAAAAAAGKLGGADSKALADLLGLLGHRTPEAGGEKVTALAAEAERALQAQDQVAATWRGLLNALSGKGGRIRRGVYVTLALGVAGLAGVFALQATYPDVVGQGMAAVLSLLSLAGGGAAALARVRRAVAPVFEAADAFAAELETAEAKARRKEADARQKLDGAERRIAEMERRRDALIADADRYRGARRDQALDFYLNESDATRAFDAGLGVISRVRRAFERLNAIMSAAHDPAKPQLGKRVGFERIVVYIDDLDRCNARQVVDVLEAVHLLLAFPLFVVVVGVDARWLERSLLEYYGEKLEADGAADPTAKSFSRQATVHDFLEKIFQIPIRLERLSALPEDAFEGYVRAAAGPVAAGGGQGGQGRQDDDKRDGITEIEPLDVEIRPPEAPAGADAEAVQLTPAEVELAAALGPIAGKTPRAVKRFINLYRLLRGMRRGDALDGFLGLAGPAGPAPFAAYQFWIAADVGLPTGLAKTLRDAVTAFGLYDLVDDALFAQLDRALPANDEPLDLLPDAGPAAPDGWPEMRAFWEAVPTDQRRQVYTAMQGVADRLPGAEGMSTLKAALKETRRFSAARD